MYFELLGNGILPGLEITPRPRSGPVLLHFRNHTLYLHWEENSQQYMTGNLLYFNKEKFKPCAPQTQRIRKATSLVYAFPKSLHPFPWHHTTSPLPAAVGYHSLPENQLISLRRTAEQNGGLSGLRFGGGERKEKKKEEKKVATTFL